MFTGIIEETARILRADQTPDGFALRVQAALTLADSRPGDSIAVNGTCLTITDIDDLSFRFGVAPETLRRTNLGSLKRDDHVNLERSVTPTTRMGGHFVQGHIDGTGVVEEVRQDNESVWLRIAAEPELMRGIVPKGYVALDGISLTVVDVLSDEDGGRAGDGSGAGFTVMLVPYTIDHVSSAFRRRGHVVNIEVDVLGKYVERILAARMK